MNILEAENIVKQYSGHLALDDVTIKVPKGSIFGLLGPNGAGKTTLIRIINRITAPDTGKLLFDGNPIDPSDVNHIGYLPEERGLYKKMKVGEQAMYLARLKGLEKSEAQERLRFWFKKFDISQWWNKKVEELSKGMQQKVQFIVTVLHKPKLLIFDEPFSGFDPINVNLLKDEILNIRNNGGTVIFSTHNMASVEELCDHIALINNSKKILDGKMVDVKSSYKKNMFEVIYKNGTHTISDDFPMEYQLLSDEDEAGMRKAKIQIPTQATPNELLTRIIEKFEVHGFTEVLPTMNDIFISKVEEAKKQ